MRPQSEIENDVKKALSLIPEIEGITHIYCHYLNQELTVQVNILLDVEMRIRDAQKIASAARMKIEQIKDIDAADLHLELDDAFSVKAFPPKRSSGLPDVSLIQSPSYRLFPELHLEWNHYIPKCSASWIKGMNINR